MAPTAVAGVANRFRRRRRRRRVGFVGCFGWRFRVDRRVDEVFSPGFSRTSSGSALGRWVERPRRRGSALSLTKGGGPRYANEPPTPTPRAHAYANETSRWRNRFAEPTTTPPTTTTTTTTTTVSIHSINRLFPLTLNEGPRQSLGRP